MMHHTQIAQRVFNTPLMVDPAKALAFLTGLGPRITGREISVEGVEIAAEAEATATLPARTSLFGDDLTNRQTRNGGQPFAVVDGIAVIEIAGTLVHRGAWIGQSSGLTSYEGIAAQLQAALADPAIRGIALDIDSFGGEVAGAFDLADRIRAARAQKPVHAFVADHALSAAYALASQADRIILPRTGTVGSIGVVAIHPQIQPQGKGPDDDHCPRRPCAACARACRKHPAGTGRARASRTAADGGGRDVARSDPRRSCRGRAGLRAGRASRHPDRCRRSRGQGRET